jgi:hypothetical protein
MDDIGKTLQTYLETLPLLDVVKRIDLLEALKGNPQVVEYFGINPSFAKKFEDAVYAKIRH